MEVGEVSEFGIAAEMGWLGDGADIVLDAVEYKYDLQTSFAVPRLSLTVPAGKVVCFPQAGQRKAVGMDTLFRVISGILLPQNGSVQVNARWKVIYVPMEPILFSGSLMYNLTLHSKAGRTDEEIWDLCKSMGLSSELIGRSSFDVGQNGDSLRYTDRIIVSLAQAVIHGVDVLLVSTVIDGLGTDKAEHVLRTLRRFVRRRGLPGERLPFELRHDKTFFYTTKYRSLWERVRPDYLVTNPEDDCPVVIPQEAVPQAVLDPLAMPSSAFGVSAMATEQPQQSPEYHAAFRTVYL
jgi:ABC-type branched-subunit amino acid transport system ATPase component